MNQFEAVIFDMDGVIFDTEKLYRKYQLLEGKKRGIPDEVMNRACERIAGGNKYTNKKPFEDIVGRNIDYFEFREHVMEGLDNHIREFGVDIKDGVKELLSYLREREVKIGLATSTARERATLYLKTHEIYDYFDKLIFGDMIENGKPAPDIYLKACELLCVEPKRAIAVEDSLNGIKSAGLAGTYPVMVIDLILPNEEVKPYIKKVYNKIIEVEELI
ncbi:MAG: HAD family phosphatase [Clostridium sp.]|nr:HAD family phosphatase [Clostridium sp.]MCM1399104.1 HAD family phosphatase [Clostridium sp.]MCM1459496.1 HAD family phosphatase [Bacteroides sp.]